MAVVIMKTFLLSIACLLSVVFAGSAAVPDYKSFRGIGGITVTTNPPPGGDGTIVIDGSGISAGALPSFALTNNQSTPVRLASNLKVDGILTNAGGAKFTSYLQVTGSGNITRTNGAAYTFIGNNGVYGDNIGTFQVGHFDGPILEFISSTFTIQPSGTPRSSLGSLSGPFDQVHATNYHAKRTIRILGITPDRVLGINGSGDVTNTAVTIDELNSLASGMSLVASNSIVVSSIQGGITNAFKHRRYETNVAHILSNLVASATAGDTIELGAGTFHIGMQTLSVPAGVELVGQGPFSTYISGLAPLFTNGPIIFPGSTSRVANLSIKLPNAHQWFQAGYGFYYAIGQMGPTNAILDNIRIDEGQTDAIYMAGSNYHSGIIRNSYIRSKWDALVKDGGPLVHATNYWIVWDSDIISDLSGATHPDVISGGLAKAIRAGAGTLVLMNCNVTATNANRAVAVAAEGSAAQASGTVNFSGVPSANDTVTINGKIYTFKSTLPGTTTNEVLIGPTATATATNLAAAVNASAGAGAVYTNIVAHTTVTAIPASGVVTNIAILYGSIGNTYTLAESAANTTVSGPTLTGGASPVMVHIVGGMYRAAGTNEAFLVDNFDFTFGPSGAPVHIHNVNINDSDMTPGSSGTYYDNTFDDVVIERQLLVAGQGTFGADVFVSAGTATIKDIVANDTLSLAYPTLDRVLKVNSGGVVTNTRAEFTSLEPLVDPNADRILFWDDSVGAYGYLTAGTGLSISGTTITATGGAGTPGGSSGMIQFAEGSSFSGTNDIVFDRTNINVSIITGTGNQKTNGLYITTIAGGGNSIKFSPFGMEASSSVAIGVNGKNPFLDPDWVFNNNGVLQPGITNPLPHLGGPADGRRIAIGHFQVISNRTITPIAGVIYGTNQVWSTNIADGISLAFSDSALLFDVPYFVKGSNGTGVPTFPASWKCRTGRDETVFPSFQGTRFEFKVVVEASGTNFYELVSKGLEIAAGNNVTFATNNGIITIASTSASGSDVVSNITVSSTANVLLDFAAANVFKLKLLTNFTYTFTNTASLTRRSLVYFQQDTNGQRILQGFGVAGGLVQTNANMQPTTNANALDLLEVEVGFFTTNLLAYWPQNFQPRVAFTNSLDDGDPAFSPEAATFDGANDYMNLGASLNATNKTGTISVWFKTGSAGTPNMFGSSGQTFTVVVGATLVIDGYADNTLNDLVLRIRSNNDYRDNAWHHLMASWNLATGASHLYVDGADVLDPITEDDTAVDYGATDFTIGSRGDSFGKWDGCLSEAFVAIEYFDLSVAGNRDNFYNAGEPVDLGATGTGGTGNQPKVYIRSWSGANAGSAGSFTINGSLTACTGP